MVVADVLYCSVDGVDERKDRGDDEVEEARTEGAPGALPLAGPTLTSMIDVSKHDRLKIETSNGDDRMIYLTDASTGEHAAASGSQVFTCMFHVAQYTMTAQPVAALHDTSPYVFEPLPAI